MRVNPLHKPVRWALCAAAVVLLAMTGCGGSGNKGAAKGASGGAVSTDRVNLPKSYKFEPPVITVKEGTKVTWTNSDNFTHTVRIGREGGRVLGEMKPGESVNYTFDKTGTFLYDCSLHPQNMKGEVRVSSA